MGFSFDHLTVAPIVAPVLGTQIHNFPGFFLTSRITDFHLAQELDRKGLLPKEKGVIVKDRV